MASSFDIPVETRFIESHEYARPEDNRVRIGISHYAAEQLGDIVFVELPELGQALEKGDTFGSVESVKAASDLYMPVSGEIVALNTQIADEPELVNDDCYGDGWMIEVELSKPDEVDGLMDAEKYVAFLEAESA